MLLEVLQCEAAIRAWGSAHRWLEACNQQSTPSSLCNTVSCFMLLYLTVQYTIHVSIAEEHPLMSSLLLSFFSHGCLLLLFVQTLTRNNSKIILLCICIGYGIKTTSEIFSICYAAPFNLHRTAVSASATRN